MQLDLMAMVNNVLSLLHLLVLEGLGSSLVYDKLMSVEKKDTMEKRSISNVLSKHYSAM
jgi:hypothetical protein